MHDKTNFCSKIKQKNKLHQKVMSKTTKRLAPKIAAWVTMVKRQDRLW